MRHILFASTAILIASCAPSQARDHSSCAPTLSGPAYRDCSFAAYTPRRTQAYGQSGLRRPDPHLASGSVDGGRVINGEAHDYDFWHDDPHGWNFWH